MTNLLFISDLHISSDAMDNNFSIGYLGSLRRILDQALNKISPPKTAIISGDLSADGTTESYKKINSLLRSYSCNFYVLPGNHDCLYEIPKTLIARNIIVTNELFLDQWKIIFVNSIFDGETFGVISEEELSKLEVNLNSSRDKPTLLVLHHSPLVNCLYHGCHIQNSEKFVSVISKYKNVKAVLSGHIHKSSIIRRNGISFVSAPSTSFQMTHVLTKKLNQDGKLITKHG